MARNGSVDPDDWRCPRCHEQGDPRVCNCMRRVKRHLDEARRHFNCGRPGMGEREVAMARDLLGLLEADAGHQRRDRPRRARSGRAA